MFYFNSFVKTAMQLNMSLPTGTPRNRLSPPKLQPLKIPGEASKMSTFTAASKVKMSKPLIKPYSVSDNALKPLKPVLPLK